MGFEEKCDKEFFQLKGVKVNEVCYIFGIYSAGSMV
jgi:hypothetical protein